MGCKPTGYEALRSVYTTCWDFYIYRYLPTSKYSKVLNYIAR